MKIKIFRRKRFSKMFFFFISIFLGVILISVGYSSWSNDMSINGELKTGKINVEFLGTDATNYYIDGNKKTIDILIGNVKPKTSYSFDVSVVNKSIIPVICDLEYDNQVSFNNDIKVIEVVNDSLTGIDMMSNENSKSIVVQVNKPENEIKGSDDGSINFKLLIGEEIEKKNYNYIQKLVFKQNENSKWENELELKINIEILKDEANTKDKTSVDTETPTVSPTETPSESVTNTEEATEKPTDKTESPMSTDGIDDKSTNIDNDEIDITAGLDKKNIETVNYYLRYAKDEFLPVD